MNTVLVTKSYSIILQNIYLVLTIRSSKAKLRKNKASIARYPMSFQTDPCKKKGRKKAVNVIHKNERKHK